MASLLALDPGLHTGWALFQIWPNRLPFLDGAGVLRPEDGLGYATPDHVIIENPRIYPNGKADPEDILKLARLVGRYEERFRRSKVYLIRPRDWKGSIDGDIMCKRIEEAMTPDEVTVAAAYRGGYRHNMIDAIGMGKWAFRLCPAIRSLIRLPEPSPQSNLSGPPRRKRAVARPGGDQE
jgi:hypothetical protein